MKKLLLLLVKIFVVTTVFTQTKDTTDGRFHDDLLDHLVGNWHVTAVAHGSRFTSEMDARWILNHQYLLIHLKSNEVIPWWGVEMEYYQYIGYNRNKQRYTIHGMSIEGDADLSEGFFYGYRSGNEFKTVAKFSSDTSVVQRLIWQPDMNTWLIQSRPEINGKEGAVFLEMKLTKAE
ncbi:MAG: hypothetical protein KF746_17310 [Chitinophagaceae bacterium]|nr:hypothetical protein [Chitinophagaceae bacterium]